MGVNYNKNCRKCGKPGVETFYSDDGEEDDVQCGRCNNIAIDRANEAREWRYFHGEG